MRGLRLPLRRSQQGFASIVAAMLLIAGVIFILMQSMGVMQTRSVDTARADDSAAAFMLAESGLENATATVGNAASSGSVSDSTCTNLSATFTLGRGTFKHLNAQSMPSPCTTNGCTTCQVTSRGVVGTAERDLKLNIEYGTTYGVTGRGTTVTMVLKNIYNQDAIALFDLSWRRQGSGGNASSTLTTNCSATCTLMWNLNSSSGMHSAGGMGTAVLIPALTPSKVVTQTLDHSRDYTEVGGLFPGLGTAPSKISAYWSDGSPGAGSTSTYANNGTTTGSVQAGVASSDTSSCVTPSSANGMNPPGNNNDFQAAACTSWCYGGDTLIMGLSARSTSVADQNPQSNPPEFDTAGNDVTLKYLVHFPNTDGTTANATGSEYSEIWYKYNPQYNSTSDPANTKFSGAGATSYSAAIVGSAGATLNFQTSGNPRFSNGKNTGITTSVTGTKACVGDAMSASGFPAGTTIFSIDGSTSASTCVSAGSSGNTIVSSQNATGNVSTAAVSSSTFIASGVTGTLTTGAATVLSTITAITVTQVVSTSTYKISPASSISNGYIVQGSNSNVITVASASDLPANATWTDSSGNSNNTLVRIYSNKSGGAGVLPANTTITAINSASKTFTISALPTTGLVGTTLCAGTCALFNTPNSTSTTTGFRIHPTAGTSQWSIGFLCLKNVNPQLIQAVTSTAIKSRTWSEAVQ